jgi:hypothetical protein
MIHCYSGCIVGAVVAQKKGSRDCQIIRKISVKRHLYFITWTRCYVELRIQRRVGSYSHSGGVNSTWPLTRVRYYVQS